jgi:hypothetical protein
MKLSTEPDAENYCFGVRFAEESNAILMAEVLEVESWGYLVKPIGDGWEQNSMDRIEVYRKNLQSNLEAQPGDVLRIEFDGLIQETYPRRIPNPYSITIAEQGTAESVTMVPTSSALTGVFDCYLFLDINGEKYRYERQETLPGGIQAGEKICTVYEDSGVGDRYDYTVFSVKSVTDGSSVLVHSKEMDEMWLYCYSPAKACAPDALQQAKDSGYLVMENSYGTCGQEQWTAFLQKTQRGEPANITIASYYTLDPATCSREYYEACREDYPWLDILELRFDGAVYTILSEDGTSRKYEYLMCYTEPSRLDPTESIIRFVLTHDDKVTWEELFHGLISSYYGAYIDHYTVYTEKAVHSGSVFLPAD